MKDINKVIKDLKEQLDRTQGDLSDVGNTIGTVIAMYFDDKELGFEKNDFISGIKHGISLIDGTHDTHNTLDVLNIKKGIEHLAKGYIYVPYILQTTTEGPSKEYSDFRKEYKRMHSLCPECGNRGHSTTLVGYVLNMDDKESYKDKNRCTCTSCGNSHSMHERTEDKNPPKEEKRDPEWKPSEGLKSRYKKMKINPKFYGFISLDGGAAIP